MFALKNPVFKRCFQAEAVSSEELFIRDEEGGRHFFKGALYVLVSRLIERGFSTAEILERGESAEIYYALMHLEKGGYLREADSFGFSPSILALLDSLSIAPEDAHRRLSECPIDYGKEALPYFEAYPFFKGDSPRFRVVLADHYRQDGLLEWNERALKDNIPWMLVKGSGLSGWVGPLFIPGETPCYACLRASLDRNRFEERWAEKISGQEKLFSKPSVWIPSVRDAAFSRAALEAFKWIAGCKDSRLTGAVETIGLGNESTLHRVLPSSVCSCLPKAAAPEGWDLSSCPIRSFDGGYRTVDPEKTWEKYSHLVSPITGFVSSVREGLSNSDSFVYYAFHNRLSRFCDELLKAGKYRETSCGKGRTRNQARAGALAEALERVSGIYRGDEERIEASFEELSSDAIHPNEIMHFSEKQYANRASLNLGCHSFSFIPRPFKADEKTDWTALWSLTHKKKKWLPTALCYFGYPPKSGEEPFAIGNSNGCAAGNTLEEAILQGLFELVERDSVALWWYSRFHCPKVDLASFQDPFFERVLIDFQEMERDLWALDLTFDLQIPAFGVLSRKKEGGGMVLGFGAHLDAKIALSRALTEAVQCLVNHREESPEETQGWVISAEQENEPYLWPANAVKTQKDYPVYRTDDVKNSVLDCVRILESKGLEVLLLNQTQAEIGLPVVRTVVPGLRSFWNRFAPGRLYDVPYQLGKVAHKLTEEELNPNPVLF